MHIPESVKDWLQGNGHGEIASIRAVGGGCINQGTRLQTTSGGLFFLKTNSRVPPDLFAREADGLHILRTDDGPRVPMPYLVGFDFLLMEDLSPASRSKNYWAVFGRQLAALHNHVNLSFGFPHDNYIGSTPQENTWVEDGYTFFAERRLLYQARLAASRALLEQRDVRDVERLAQQLPGLIPVQPASLIHGDLWSGNAITDATGEPALIDPAVYYGWGEAELAMTALFGAFPNLFYQSYLEVRPLSPGFWQRFPIYNLYHLLNHLNLFGRGYYEQIRGILRQFS